MYRRFAKRLFDIILSFLGLVILSPIFLLIILWIRLDSKGSAFFTQQRVGKDKVLFPIYKFRTMRIDAPHDMPTHMLQDADSYITRCGAFLRRTSLDELPQIWNILVGHMSIIGPRPALWNQEDLIAARDAYGANSIRPGLTGWAQINGRDELEIAAKAKLDGEYTAALNAGRFKGLSMDARCFFGTIVRVLKSDGVVEGGTGKLNRKKKPAALQK